MSTRGSHGHSFGSSTVHRNNQHALHIDTSGLRRRMKQLPDHDDDENDGKEYIYLQMKDNATMPRIQCAIYVVLWVATLIAALYVGQHYVCNISNRLLEVECKSPDYIYSPVLMDHMITGMKTNRRVKSKSHDALLRGEFDVTATWKTHFYGFKHDTQQHQFVYDNAHNQSVHISAIVYSNQYTSRIGEVAVPLTVCYYENSIDQMVIVDDTQNHKSAELWEHEILFADTLPSKQLKVNKEQPEYMRNRYEQWDETERSKKNNKQFVRTGNIGVWRGLELGSRLAFVPKSQHRKLQQQQTNDLELVLLLDTTHQLPMDDEWISNALALFEQHPKMQVLGGFSGVIKNGKTFGDVNFGDMRTKNMDKEAQVFVMSRRSSYHTQMMNKRRYDESRVNIVELMDTLKAEYYDKYLKTFWKKAKRMYKTGKLPFHDIDDEDAFHIKLDEDMDEEDEDKPVGLWSMNFLNDFDKAVFMDEEETLYNPDKVQTGLEGIEYILKKRFLKYYEKELERRLPIPAKVIKQIEKRRKECRVLLEAGTATEDQKHECEVLMNPGGQTVVDYYFIPYEQKIRNWNANKQQAEESWIPFMFITSVRMGPIFVRRDWWFDKLLPHLSELEATMGKVRENWFDIELSLYTWALGGYVGLYDAEGFRYDMDAFELGLNRNSQADSEWDEFQSNHHLAQYADWNVWNVSHLIDLNEDKEKQKDLRLRTSVGSTSANPEHPTALENSRQLMLTERAFEQTFEFASDRDGVYSKVNQEKNPFFRVRQNKNANIHNPLN